MEYIIVEEQKMDDMVRAVNEKLTEEYTLCGGLAIRTNGPYNYFCQAMVKFDYSYEDIDEEDVDAMAGEEIQTDVGIETLVDQTDMQPAPADGGSDPA